MSPTCEAILDAAYNCFFRHGYGATNIAMISRQAKISRVTIHKHFGPKEQLFRSLVQQHMDEIRENFPQYEANHDSIWEMVENLLLDCGGPLFEEITDQWVKDDLICAGNEYCADIKAKHFSDLEGFMEKQFRQAEEQGQISLDKLPMGTSELARSINAMARGLFTTAPIEECRTELLWIIAVYKAATQP